MVKVKFFEADGYHEAEYLYLERRNVMIVRLLCSGTGIKAHAVHKMDPILIHYELNMLRHFGRK